MGWRLQGFHLQGGARAAAPPPPAGRSLAAEPPGNSSTLHPARRAASSSSTSPLQSGSATPISDNRRASSASAASARGDAQQGDENSWTDECLRRQGRDPWLHHPRLQGPSVARACALRKASRPIPAGSTISATSIYKAADACCGAWTSALTTREGLQGRTSTARCSIGRTSGFGAAAKPAQDPTTISDGVLVDDFKTPPGQSLAMIWNATCAGLYEEIETALRFEPWTPSDIGMTSSPLLPLLLYCRRP